MALRMGVGGEGGDVDCQSGVVDGGVPDEDGSDVGVGNDGGKSSYEQESAGADGSGDGRRGGSCSDEFGDDDEGVDEGGGGRCDSDDGRNIDGGGDGRHNRRGHGQNDGQICDQANAITRTITESENTATAHASNETSPSFVQLGTGAGGPSLCLNSNHFSR